jgi:predicted P-loop ATPase
VQAATTKLHPKPTLAHPVSVTFIKDHSGATMVAQSITLPALRDLILETTGATKATLPWLKGARFGDKRTDAGSLRHTDNVLGFDMIELDYDQEVMTFDEAVTTLKAMDVRALIYTTPSHTAAAPRFRLLLPVSRGDYPLATRAKLCARVNGRFGGIFARESFVLSQGYYYGLALDNPSPDHHCDVIDGRFVDLCDDLFKYQDSGWPKSLISEASDAIERAPSSSSGLFNLRLADDHDRVALALREIPNEVDWNDWNGIGMAAWAATDGSEVGFQAFDDWSQKSTKYDPVETRARWEHYKKSPPRKIGMGTLVYLARQNNPAFEAHGTSVVSNGSAEPTWRERRVSGKPVPSMHNARLAIDALGIVCSRDVFHNKTLFGYRDDNVKHELSSILGEVSDDGIIALRQLMSDHYGFDMEDKATRDAVKSLAQQYRFDPVVDMIDQAERDWDGVERLDRMAADYFNCEDTPINRAFMRKTMIGLIKRAREPGCKFDTIVVLESGEGYNKSTAWRILAGDENFSDESIIGKSSREVQEQLSEVWIHENADLAGLRKADIETVKAYASRMVDIARPAFGHFPVKQPRHSIEVATTNSSEYLQSQTGNRRFWPMEVLKSIDVERLRRDRLQLIGEAASYHTAGESVVLDEAMWGDAGVEQEQRRTKDPWEDLLENLPMYWDTIDGYDSERHPVKKAVLVIHLDGFNQDRELVSSATLLKHVLDIPVGQQTTLTAMRLSTVMKQLGWDRNKNGYVSISGLGRVKGYFRDAVASRVAA